MCAGPDGPAWTLPFDTEHVLQVCDGLGDGGDSLRCVVHGVDHHEVVDDAPLADLGDLHPGAPQLRGEGLPLVA